MVRLTIAALLTLCPYDLASSIPPLVCSSGGPVASVDLFLTSPQAGKKPLALRTINRLEEGDTLHYRPLLRQGEQRKGDVAIVLVPANKPATGEKLLILDPKPANEPQEWVVPWRVSLITFVYGPAGLNTKKVRRFLSRDDELIGQLADYAEKTAKTEALIAQLSSPDSSPEAFQSALQGFSSQFGLNVQVARNAPTDQQARALFQTLNPAMASYDPLSASPGSPAAGQTARLATSVGELFFGTPVGLAAGGTALVLDLRALAFPNAEFRSSFSQPLEGDGDGLGLCGKTGSAAAHTRVAYLWAMRVPNAGPPSLAIGKANSLPPTVKSPLPVTTSEAGWKFVDRALNWELLPDNGKPIPVKVQKMGDSKKLELDPGKDVKPGRYRLAANWDWDHFEVNGFVQVRPVSDFASVRLLPSSQDHLVAKTGKVPVTLANGDFEFVTKVEMEKLHDEFASPSVIPFVLPVGLREGPQTRMDVQIDTGELDSGAYKLIVSEVDGKAHDVNVEILPAPPLIENFPVVVNQGASAIEFVLKGQRLNLLRRLEIANGKAKLASNSTDQAERVLTLEIAPNVSAGTSFAIKAFIDNRSEPMIFSDAVRIVGPRPKIIAATISKPPDERVQIGKDEVPGGMYLSAMLTVEHFQTNSIVRLGCEPAAGKSLNLRLGERSGPVKALQLTPNQIFLSFDTSEWPNGCALTATVVNDGEGESAPYSLGRVVLIPAIESFELTPDSTGDSFHASLTGENLETIERIGWTADRGEPVSGLPLPLGSTQKQRLEIVMGPQPDPDSPLFVWLRNESQPRVTTVRPDAPSH